MKFLSCIRLNKYQNQGAYEPVDTSQKYYHKLDTDSYVMCFYTELEEGDDTEYPLTDVLEKYGVKTTDYVKDTEKDGKRIFVFEVEAKTGDSYADEKTIKSIALLIGKRAYNQQAGDFIELKIKAMDK